jgi:hypothetical protein
MNNLLVMMVGFANITDGLIRIFSLGFIKSPGLGQLASFYYAKQSMKKEYLKNE